MHTYNTYAHINHTDKIKTIYANIITVQFILANKKYGLGTI